MSAADDTSALAHKLAGGEKAATKELGDILNRSCSARAALRDLLKINGADVGSLTRVDTEVVGVYKYRPDLVAYDQVNDKRVVIEVKFSADLADNQPADYLRWLPENDNWYVLLFVAPEYRLETLWYEIRDMAQRGGFTLKDATETGRLRVAAVAGGNRRLMLTSWRLLLEKMRSHASVAGDSSAEQDIRQLNELCEQEDSPAFLPLRVPELGPELPRRMLNYQRLVDDAVERLVRKGRAKTEGLRVAPQATGYGRYVHIGIKESSAWEEAWLGVDYKLWATKAGAPIWIYLKDDPHPLPLRTGVEYEEVLEGLVKQLLALADCVAPAAKLA